MNAAFNMRNATDNEIIKARAVKSIDEGRKNIEYLEERLRTLQLQMQRSGPPTPQHGGREYYRQQSEGNMVRSPIPTPPPRDQNGRLYGGGDPGGTGEMSPRAPVAYQPLESIPKARPNFSKLGKSHQA